MRVRKRKRLSMNVDDIEFTIQEDRRLGLCRITYNRYADEKIQEGLVTQFRLLSCWMNQQTGNAIKAYLVRTKNNPMHTKLIEDIKTLGMIPARNGFCFTTDGQYIRYGIKPGSQNTSSDSETYDKLTFFDSKARALKEILEQIGRHQTIGGLNMVSLNRLPDTLLVETGFEKVDDLMRDHNSVLKKDIPRGVSMWLGSPDKAIGSSNDWRDREGAANSRKQFLDLLNRMLQ